MTIKERVAQAKEVATEKTKQAISWCRDNPELALGIATTIVAGGKILVKQYNRDNGLRRQEEIKTKFYYDRSYGHYWPLKRKLTTREYMEIDRRKDSGEKLRDILDDMRVLK